MQRAMIRRAIVPMAVLAVAASGSRWFRPPRTRRSASARRCCATCCSSATTGTGTADVIARRAAFTRVARLNIIPDIDERMAEIQTDPERLGYFLAIRELIGEGHDQFVDDMFSLARRPAALVSRPQPRRRRRDRPERRARSSGASRSTAIAPTTWPSRPTARGVARLRLDRRRSCTSSTPRRGQIVGALPVRRLAAREQLLEGRQADLPRQHRHRLHAGRPPAASTRRRATACFEIVDARRLPGHQADRHGQEARRRPATRT